MGKVLRARGSKMSFPLLRTQARAALCSAVSQLLASTSISSSTRGRLLWSWSWDGEPRHTFREAANGMSVVTLATQVSVL